jgi:hypothetical protein
MAAGVISHPETSGEGGHSHAPPHGLADPASIMADNRH